MEGTEMIMKKLDKHPYYKHRTLEEKQKLASEFTDPEKLKLKFSHLLDVGTRLAMNYTREREEDFLTSQDFREHHKRVKQETAQACNLPIRLSLQSVKETKIPLVHSFTSMLKFEYGPFHASLTIDDVTLSWGRGNIVQPRFHFRAEADFQAIVGDQGDWDARRDEFVQQISMADRRKNKEEKFDIIYQSLTEKVQVIDRLVAVIVDYNKNKDYHIFKCNCQHFVQDALEALGIHKPVQFSGLLQERFEQLKRGKLRVPAELQSHESVDMYVAARKCELERHDMEYLQCLYFDFHLPAIEESDDPQNWRCDIPACMSEELDRMIGENYVSLNPNQTSNNPPAVEEQSVNGVASITQVTFDAGPDFAQDIDDQETSLASVQQEDLCPSQFLEMSLEKQTKLVRKFKGYRTTVCAKYRQHPQYERGTEDEMVEILTERERLYQDYFSTFVDKSKHYILDITENNNKLEAGEITWTQVSTNIRQTLDRICNFPQWLVYRVDFKNVKSRKPVLQTPLRILLQVNDVLLEWDKSGLVVPVKAEEPTGNVVRVEHIVLLKDFSASSKWNKQVQEWKSMVESAIARKEQTAVVPILYEITEHQEELMNSLLQLVVRYNRYSQYHPKSCTNEHFIQEALRTLGVSEPPPLSKSLESYMQTCTTGSHAEVANTDHSNFDSYVFAHLTGQPSTQELEFFISKYFAFHIEDWKRQSKANKDWTCSLNSCQLLHLLKIATV